MCAKPKLMYFSNNVQLYEIYMRHYLSIYEERESVEPTDALRIQTNLTGLYPNSNMFV